MIRSEQKHTTLRKKVQDNGYLGTNSHSHTKDNGFKNIGSVTTSFQALVENCGFKVIGEGKDNYECLSGNDRSKMVCVPSTGTTTSSGRWSTGSYGNQKEVQCTGKKTVGDSTTDSKQNDIVLKSENIVKESTAPETYLVSRKCGNVCEPTVDYLDMTDIGDTMERCLHNADSKKDKFSEAHSCIAPAAVQYTIKSDNQRRSVKSEKRRTRYKIMKQDISNVKNKNKYDKSKLCNIWKLSSRNEQLQSKQSRDSIESRDFQSQNFNFPLRKDKETLCWSSNSRLGDELSGGISGKSEDNLAGHTYTKTCNIIKAQTTENVNNENSAVCMRENIGRVSEFDPESIQAFSNINSSCLRQGSGQQNQIITPNDCDEGGMLSFLRKLKTKNNTGGGDITQHKESREHNKDSLSRKTIPDRRSFNTHSNYRNSKSDATLKHSSHYNKDSTYLLSSNKLTCINKAKLPLSRRNLKSQPKSCPRTAKKAPRMPRVEFHSNGCEKDNCGSNISQYKATIDVPVSTIQQKGVNSNNLQSEDNDHEDCNINFNSEDGVDENVCANSFIGHYLYELWRHQCLCDVRLKVGNTSFLAHKIVLAAFSDIFCPEDPRQIPTLCFDIPDVSEEALCLILQYLYTSEMEITDSVLESVYTAASVLEIGEITDLVSEILSKPTIENFEKYMGIRQRIGLQGNIMEVYKDFICENLLDIEDSPYILNMQVAQMEKLLRDPDVKIECEEDIIRLIIKWIKYNPCSRSKHSSDLLSLVNFDCVGPEALSSIVEQNRHLFDLASMDIIMAAFKDFALKCKEFPPKGPSSKAKCVPLTSRFREEESCQSCEAYEGPENSPVECLYGGGNSYNREKRLRARKLNVVSPQEIRKNATKHCWGKEKSSLQCYKNCYDELNKRYSKSSALSVCSPSSETKYTIRKRKQSGDSSNNFPSEFLNRDPVPHRPSPDVVNNADV